MNINILQEWCKMLELIDKSKTVKRFMWLSYGVFLLGLIIWKPEILNVVAGLLRTG